MTTASPDYPALLLADLVMGDGESSRLWRRIRERDGLGYSVGSTLLADDVDPGALLTVRATSAPQDAARVAAAVDEEVARLLRKDIGSAELEAVQDRWLKTRRLGWSQDELLVDELLGQTAAGWTFHDEVDLERRVAALTPARVRAALNRHIAPRRFSVVIAGGLPASEGRVAFGPPGQRPSGPSLPAGSGRR
jgi:zinc protease